MKHTDQKTINEHHRFMRGQMGKLLDNCKEKDIDPDFVAHFCMNTAYALVLSNNLMNPVAVLALQAAAAQASVDAFLDHMRNPDADLEEDDEEDDGVRH